MYFRNLLRMYFQERKPLLGRWYINYQSEEYLDRKIYLANYDNCGPCGKILLNTENK